MNQQHRTIRSLRDAIQNRSVTATDLATEYLAAIRAGDQVPGAEINSFLSLAKDRALGQAAAVDELARKGDPLPVLAGIPIAIKDVLTMRGAPATAGSAMLKGYHPPYDATAVARLDAAGATLLGKLNCDEFAMGSSNENSAFGPVRNPRALDRVPGGS
ncbi:MAG: amidase family protein, partial [Janthinobacterium lividum]